MSATISGSEIRLQVPGGMPRAIDSVPFRDSKHDRSLLSLLDWDVNGVSFSDVLGPWADEFVVGVLFKDVTGPA